MSLRHNTGSLANGALMRVAPLAVWAHREPAEAIFQHCAADASLSHPNPVCAEASAAYCIAIAHLIRCPGDAEGALAAACTWAEQHAGECGPRGSVGSSCCCPVCRAFLPSSNCLYLDAQLYRLHAPRPCAGPSQEVSYFASAPFLQPCRRRRPATFAGSEVRGWLEESAEPLDSFNCLESLGFVRHAFVMAFHHLRQHTPFEAAIAQVRPQLFLAIAGPAISQGLVLRRKH